MGVADIDVCSACRDKSESIYFESNVVVVVSRE